MGRRVRDRGSIRTRDRRGYPTGRFHPRKRVVSVVALAHLEHRTTDEEGRLMGYHTEFSGEVNIDPPLNAAEIEYLAKFAATRRMERSRGPYFVDGISGWWADSEDDIQNYNTPPAGQPGLWCHWVPSEDGTCLLWDGGENFYDSAEWMKYLIDHFLKPGCLAKPSLSFLQANHTMNGVIDAQGEDIEDRRRIEVLNNKVS